MLYAEMLQSYLRRSGPFSACWDVGRLSVRNKSGTLSAQFEAPGALKGTLTIAFTCLKS
jgi:hypothetical protein